jgi:hypothetical protein
MPPQTPAVQAGHPAVEYGKTDPTETRRLQLNDILREQL